MAQSVKAIFLHNHVVLNNCACKKDVALFDEKILMKKFILKLYLYITLSSGD